MHFNQEPNKEKKTNKIATLSGLSATDSAMWQLFACDYIVHCKAGHTCCLFVFNGFKIFTEELVQQQMGEIMLGIQKNLSVNVNQPQ